MYLKPKIKKIVRLREKSGLSKHQLSLKAGLGNQALSRIERGETKKVHPLRAQEIAKVLDCNVVDIFEVERNIRK